MMVDLLMVIINIKMGNTEPFTKPFENEVYLDQIQQLEQNDLMFQSKLSNTSHQVKLLKKVYSFNSASEDIINYLQTLNFLGQYIECENLMLPIYCYIHKLRGVCSDQKELQIYHEIYNINIKDEITARKKHQEKFSQPEIWYLLYAIVNACRQFQPYKIKSGILKTNFIMLNDRGHVKMKNILSEPEIKPSILPNYFSPEELINMRQKRSVKIHPNISQTFSVAIIILEICTFIDGESYYDMHRLKINQVYIQRALEIVQKQKYSKLLINLLKTMLSSHTERPLPSQVYLTFKPYEHQITNLQSFKFDPNKMNENLQNSKVSIISQY